MQKIFLSIIFLSSIFFFSNIRADDQKSEPIRTIASERKNAVVLAVEKVSSSVVNISSEQIVTYKYSDPFLREFFNSFFDEYYQRKYAVQSLGSGIIINKNGYILTNEHVIEKADKITVILSTGKKYAATRLGSSKEFDIAVLKIDETDLPVATLGKSDDLMIGEYVIAIGNPFGLQQTVTLGVVSAIGRSFKKNIDNEEIVLNNLIQTDASINPGNSGGPLCNVLGEVIGINTAIYSEGQGIGFAIPINTARKVFNDLIKYNQVIPVFTGIEVQNITGDIANYFALAKEENGIIISSIKKDSPADKSGLKRGDIILEINSAKMTSTQSFSDFLFTLSPNDTLNIKILREKDKLIKTLIAEEYKIPSPQTIKKTFGLTCVDITKKLIFNYDLYLDYGVVVTNVDNGSTAYKSGIQPGDIVLQINEDKISNMKDYEEALKHLKIQKDNLIFFQRGPFTYYTTVTIK